MRRFLHIFLVSLLAVCSGFAQSIPTATITGKVTADGADLPGVLVTATSPNLQGERTTVTTSAGDYIFPFLPPGEYTVKFELAGMQTISRKLTLTATRTDRIEVDLKPSAVSESITVTAETPMTAAVESTQVSTNFKQDLVESLPVNRNLEAVTLLAPGVNNNGPGSNIIISGAMSYDSLYLINGAIVNENLRGQPHSLFIEDAIQETTVLTGGISAEYGHFTGGVVSAITKSGGNNVKGSFRTSFTNESWAYKTPFTTDQADELNRVYEATLGGPIWQDRVWFFAAGRNNSSEDVRQTNLGVALAGDQDANGVPIRAGAQLTPITYPHSNEETRLEGKLTASITPRHNIVASYADIAATETNQHFDVIMDLASLNAERETPNTLLVLNYNGSLSNRFFLEGQYSKKDYGFFGGGSRFSDLIHGTLVLDRARGTRFNTPTFKYEPEGEQRDHALYTVKGTYFWSTPRFGSHDIKGGYEDFSEVRLVNNYNSGSDFRLSVTSTIIRGDQIFIRAPGGSTGTATRIEWRTIFTPSEGSDYASKSLFLNDRWTLNNHWTFNLGVRYDQNDALGGDKRLKIADDSAISPRVAANYDIFGNGRITANVSFAQYVGRLAEGVGNDADPAGRTANFAWNYRGPSINNNVNTPTSELVPTEEVLRRIFDWFNANGGTDLRPLRSVSIPGVDTIIDPNGLESPNVKEYTVGFGSALGRRGYARVDLVRRNWDDFYTAFATQNEGKVRDEFGNEFDLTVIRNSNVYDREYTGVQTQFAYRPLDRLNLGGTYTWSRLVGNVNGENSADGPTTGSAMSYPEYREESWNYPMGYLTGDQRHRLKAWASYDLPTRIGKFNFSLLQNFDSGTRFSSIISVDPSAYTPDLGYLDPPEAIDYFLKGRGDLKTDNITRTDFGLNYSVKLVGNVQLFFQPEIINLFNEQGIVSYDATLLTAEDDDTLSPFNPFTETPVEGVHYRKAEGFGEPDSEGDFQTPRTYRFSVGVRF